MHSRCLPIALVFALLLPSAAIRGKAAFAENGDAAISASSDDVLGEAALANGDATTEMNFPWEKWLEEYVHEGKFSSEDVAKLLMYALSTRQYFKNRVDAGEPMFIFDLQHFEYKIRTHFGDLVDKTSGELVAMQDKLNILLVTSLKDEMHAMRTVIKPAQDIVKLKLAIKSLSEVAGTEQAVRALKEQLAALESKPSVREAVEVPRFGHEETRNTDERTELPGVTHGVTWGFNKSGKWNIL